MPRHSVTPIRYVSESPRCQLSNGTFHILLASVPAEQQATIKIVFTGEFLLNLKTDISMLSHSLTPVRYMSESPRCQPSNSASPNLLASVSAELQAAMKLVFNSEFLLVILTPSYSLTSVRHVPDSPQCQPSNGASHTILTSVLAELQAAMKMVFTSKFPLTLKTDISMPSDSLIPVRHVLGLSRCQHSNSTSHNLLPSVSTELHAAIELVFIDRYLDAQMFACTHRTCSEIPAMPAFQRCLPHPPGISSNELQAAMEMVFTSEFLLTSKTHISMPSHSLMPVSHLLMPVKHVPESPQCRLSNSASHVLLESVSAELQAAMEIVFNGESLLDLKTNISTASYSVAPLRHVPESPRCQRSNGTSHVLLASVPTELLAAIEMVFTGEFLLTLETDISMPSNSPASIGYVPEFPRCQLSNRASHIHLASVSAELQAAIKIVFTGEFLLTLQTDISIPSHLLAPIRHVPESPRMPAFQQEIPRPPGISPRQATGCYKNGLYQHVPESPRCQLSNGVSHILLASCSAELQAAMELTFIGKFLLTLKTDISKPRCLPMPIRHVLESPQCQLSNATSHVLLASVPGKL
ncbi:hypothetical protein L873DRAFT_1882032 [Choiromyces venosus 120613-1]|uniref:Uncharacterized protein n=1 Tax=Choiromyces venosus 120613-1 TaxID=1336337 RepID=A0A3N4IUY5_9PEZI|nr:hypothetical protein L873DRAFT_1882032 [Choiromyces venosus 120613-1]